LPETSLDPLVWEREECCSPEFHLDPLFGAVENAARQGLHLDLLLIQERENVDHWRHEEKKTMGLSAITDIHMSTEDS
jgi:hypothetical protein